jgi:hypothetical protein
LVDHSSLLDRLVELKAVSYFPVRRIPQHGTATADDHRKILDGKVEPVQHLLDSFI